MKLCAAIILINMTANWSDFDESTLNRAKIRCKQLYKDAPCLKKFTKKNKNTYRAICGEYK